LSVGRAARAAALALLLIGWASAPAFAQRGGSGRGGGGAGRPLASAGDSLELRRHSFAALAVSPHPWSTVVAITVLIPGGSAEDDPLLPGGAWLLADVVRDELEAPLARTGASISVTVDRGSTRFQALAAPGEWRSAYETLIDGLFLAPVGFETLERRRAEIADVFAFEKGAPVREFQSEFAKLMGGGGAWSREPRGNPESLQRITASDLSALRRRVYRQEEAVVTIVGALDAAPGIAVYPGGGRDGDDLRSRRPSGSGPSWGNGQRERLVRAVTNTWIGVAFPARRDVSRTVLEFLADRLRAELNPYPRDPGLFGTEVRLEDLPDGPAIVLEAAILPEDLARWELRILRTTETLEDLYDDASFFSLHQRHFLNTSLVQESAPEAEGIRIAMDVLRDGRVRSMPAEIESLTADGLRRAISSLGEPRILVFGPDLGR
jgi:hypothetical protein